MGTYYKGTAKEVNTLNSFINLVRAYESLSSRLYMLFEKYGLTESQFYTLDALYNLGMMNQKELGKKIYRSEGNITMVVNNLIKSNLIKKQKSEDDKRIYFITITNKGRKVYESVFPKFLELLMLEFLKVKDKEHEVFQKVCNKIGMKNPNQQLSNSK